MRQLDPPSSSRQAGSRRPGESDVHGRDRRRDCAADDHASAVALPGAVHRDAHPACGRRDGDWQRLYPNRWTVVALLAACTLRHAIAKSGTNTLEGYFHPRQLAFAFGLWRSPPSFGAGRSWPCWRWSEPARPSDDNAVVCGVAVGGDLAGLHGVRWPLAAAARRWRLGLVGVRWPGRWPAGYADGSEWLDALAGRTTCSPPVALAAWLANLATFRSSCSPIGGGRRQVSPARGEGLGRLPARWRSCSSSRSC